MISCKNLTKKFEATTAVSNLNFDIQEGQICGFLGMNGAGKTTTIRMLTGVIEASEGQICIGGYDFPRYVREAKKITGYIPDRPYLYPSMTPLEFLSFIGDLYEVPHEVIRGRIKELLTTYGLWEKRNDLIQGFSHGMKQRLATASALIHNPKVLIIDEPMVGLDPHGARALKKSLRSYAESGMTIFLSTHSLFTAEELCDSVIIIHHGVILSQGTIDQIKCLVQSGNQNLEDVFIELTKNAGSIESV